MIYAENLTKHFENIVALNGLNLHVKKGSVYGLIGPNGAGKTTLMKHLLGVFRPDSGKILIDNQKIYENQGLKARIIYIGDDLYTYSGYSVNDTAQLYRTLYPNWDDARFESLKAVFPIDCRRKVRKLSKGMQKQTAFWLAVSAKPDIYILDEPVDGLDPVMRKNVWKLILQDVAQRQATVLISSHNLRELEDVCDHVGILHNGKIVLEKSLDDVKGNIHKVQAAFADTVPNPGTEKITVLHHETFGSVHSYILKGDLQDIKNIFAAVSPVIFDVLPLTLEEVFIYELGGIGYVTQDITL